MRQDIFTILESMAALINKLAEANDSDEIKGQAADLASKVKSVKAFYLT